MLRPQRTVVLRGANATQQIEDLRLRRGVKPQAVLQHDKAKNEVSGVF